MPDVFIPASLQTLTQGTRVVQMQAASLREVIEELEERFPGIRARLCSSDRLRPGLSVALDSQLHGGSLHLDVTNATEIHFVPAVGGG